MILNPARLLEGCPPASIACYKLRLLEHYLLRPLADVFDFTVPSAYRSTIDNAALYALDPERAARKARGISQHVLGEAADIVPVGRTFKECFLWIAEHLRPWQLILEAGPKGRWECIHLSLPSERQEIAAKRLLFYGGEYRNFDGTFPDEAAA